MSLYREGHDPVTLLTTFLVICLLVALAVAFLAYAIDARTIERQGQVTITHESAHASAEVDLMSLRKGDRLK